MKRIAFTAAAWLLFLTSIGAQGISVRDSLDREVRLPVPASRVVSLSPSATETLFEIGAGDRVVGVTDYCDWPAEAATRASVGGYSAQSISLERVLSLRPDLVVSGGPVHASIRSSLERLGMIVYVFEPESVEDTLEGAEDLGLLTGMAERASLLVSRIRGELDDISARVASVPAASRARVFWEVNFEPLITCGSRSFLDELITRAGGINVFGDVTAAWPLISTEEVVRRAPQVILSADDREPTLTAAAFSRRPGWDEIPAVRDGRVYFLPADPVSRTGPRLASGVRLIARALYPELFP